MGKVDLWGGQIYVCGYILYKSVYLCREGRFWGKCSLCRGLMWGGTLICGWQIYLGTVYLFIDCRFMWGGYIYVWRVDFCENVVLHV